MKRRTVVWVMAVLVIFTVQSVMAQTKAELKKITDSVYAYVGVPAGTPGNAFCANAGIIIGKDAVLVVDTLTSAGEAESFFADRGARIIGHAKCRAAMIAGGEKILENPAMFGLPPDFWEKTRVAAPDIAFDHEMMVDLGGLNVKLIYSGLKSHTAGSIIVHVPEQDVLFAGDMLFTDFHAYLGEGDFPEWQKNLDLLSAMNVQYIIPGHGPLSSNKDIEDMKIYLKIFDQKATAFSAVECRGKEC